MPDWVQPVVYRNPKSSPDGFTSDLSKENYKKY